MNKKLIKENNKLIAEFMGYKQFVYTNPWNNQKEIYYHKTNKEKEVLEQYAENYPWMRNAGEKTILRELNYHSDWNILMGVVEKIENMGYSPRIERVENGNHFCWIWNNKKPDDNPDVAEYSDKKIEAVYNSVIKFIKN